jgi:FkbM family methyltransferase
LRVNERVTYIVWSLAVRLRDKAAQFGLLGLGEATLLLLTRPALNLVASNDTTAIIADDLKIIAPNSYSGLRFIRAGLYERALSNLFRILVRPGMTVVDLGANIGYYTILASGKVGGTGRVYSFEPDPRAYAYLLRNIEINRCTNVEPMQFAVGDGTSTKWFNSDPGLAEGYVTINPGRASARVDLVSLDEYFGARGWPSVDLIKLDVEGSEGAALAGMKSLAHRNRKMRIVMEYSDKKLSRANTSPETIVGTLRELGYSRGYIIERRMKRFSLEKGLPRSSATYNLLFAERANT